MVHKYLWLGLLVIGSLSLQNANAQSLVNESEAKVFVVVEDMPIPWLYKTTCLEVDNANKYDCYLQQLGLWLAQEVDYPYPAIKSKTEGTVVVRFVVNTEGAVTDLELVKDIGNGCGKEALEAVGNMPDWIPGRQRGEAVNVRMTLPVQFRLKE